MEAASAAEMNHGNFLKSCEIVQSLQRRGKGIRMGQHSLGLLQKSLK